MTKVALELRAKCPLLFTDVVFPMVLLSPTLAWSPVLHEPERQNSGLTPGSELRHQVLVGFGGPNLPEIEPRFATCKFTCNSLYYYSNLKTEYLKVPGSKISGATY